MGLGVGLGALEEAADPCGLPEADWACDWADPAGAPSFPAHSARPTPAATVAATAPAISPRACFSDRFLC